MEPTINKVKVRRSLWNNPVGKSLYSTLLRKEGDPISKLRRFAIVGLLSFMYCLMLVGCLYSTHRPNTPSGTEQVIVDPIKRISQVAGSVNWIVYFSIIGAGAGTFAFLSGHSKGLQIIAACFVMLSLSLMVVRYALWIAFLTIVGAVLLAIYVVFVNKKALHELVVGAEKLKHQIPDRSLFKETIGKQSETTKQIVASERLKITKAEGSQL